ncbi:MAG: anaerobic ribonucleoside-triphosphate reductase activating protein [Bacillota bacterium]|nr:anaerobic ribonucleoside-triphosphate reductase activating protein [Bacillota bacterium]
MLRIAGIVRESIVDGPGIRMVVFTQGCNHNCKGCHNPETHDFSGGKEVSCEEVIRQMDSNPLLDGITFSGGDPFEQADVLAEIAVIAKSRGLNVMTYTGYTYERLIAGIPERKGWAELLKLTDILVDGPFKIEQKNMLLKFKGSENQRIIDLEKTRQKNEIVLADI